MSTDAAMDAEFENLSDEDRGHFAELFGEVERRQLAASSQPASSQPASELVPIFKHHVQARIRAMYQGC